MTALSMLAGLPASVRPGVFVYPLGVWLGMAVIAVANGVFREAVIVPRTGEYPGHLLSTVLLIAAILLVSFLFFQRTSIPYTRAELVVVGVIWVILTVGFEFVVGYVEDTPIAVTLGQYNLLAGQVWIFVPLTLLLAPLLFGWYLPRW